MPRSCPSPPILRRRSFVAPPHTHASTSTTTTTTTPYSLPPHPRRRPFLHLILSCAIPLDNPVRYYAPTFVNLSDPFARSLPIYSIIILLLPPLPLTNYLRCLLALFISHLLITAPSGICLSAYFRSASTSSGLLVLLSSTSLITYPSTQAYRCHTNML